MTGLLRELALELFQLGAIKFGSFRLKMHEEHPDAPLSPIYLNLRTADNPKPGPLTAEVMALIGRALGEAVWSTDLDFFDCVAGIPNAGDPLAYAFVEAVTNEFGWSGSVVRMTKIEESGKRRIADLAETLQPDQRRFILIDDLITAADTKFEAVEAVTRAGRQVAMIVVLVDREQGGVAMLTEKGYKTISVFTLTELLDLYVDEGLIEASVRDGVQSYKQQVDVYFASLAATT